MTKTIIAVICFLSVFDAASMEQLRDNDGSGWPVLPRVRLRLVGRHLRGRRHQSGHAARSENAPYHPQSWGGACAVATAERVSGRQSQDFRRQTSDFRDLATRLTL